MPNPDIMSRDIDHELAFPHPRLAKNIESGALGNIANDYFFACCRIVAKECGGWRSLCHAFSLFGIVSREGGHHTMNLASTPKPLMLPP